MWNGLGEALPLQLTIDTPYQVVGGAPEFRIIGAPPGAAVLWSSYKDGQPTAEFNAGYGQVVEPNGTAKLTGGAWLSTDAGTWIKEVLVQDANGQNYRGVVQFRVGAAPATTTTPTTPATTGSFWENPLFSVGDFEVTPAVAGLGLAALYFFTKKR